MTVRCPGCRTEYRIPDDGMEPGAKLRCRACGTVFSPEPRETETASPATPPNAAALEGGERAVPLEEVMRRVAPVTGGLSPVPPAPGRLSEPPGMETPPSRPPRPADRGARGRGIPWGWLLAALLAVALVAGMYAGWRHVSRGRGIERLLMAKVLVVFGGPEVIRQPAGLAVIPDGRIAVVDKADHLVEIFSPAGEPAGRLGGFGVGDVNLWDPEGLSYAAGRLATFDTGNGSIKVFDLSGTVVAKYPVYGDFYLPRDLSLGEDGGIVVADTGNHRLPVLAADGSRIREIGRKGRGEGELNNPYSVIRLPGGRIAAADVGNNRISLFDADGKPRGGWRYEGRNGQYSITPSLGWVWGLSLIALADQHLQQVQFFEPDGRFIGAIDRRPDGRHVFGDSGPLFVDSVRPGELVVLTEQGRVFVLGY